MTFEQTLIITIIGSLVTGFLAIFGVVLTLKQNNQQMMLQFQERQEDKKQTVIDNRPEFEILDVRYSSKELGFESDESVDIDVMATIYGQKYTKDDFDNHLCYVEYKLQNIGHGRVEYLDLCFCNNNVELLDMKRNDIDSFVNNPGAFLTTTYIRYAGAKVKHNEVVKIRIWYRVGNVVKRQFVSYPSFIGIKSFDKRYWYQNFDTPYDGLEDSVLIAESRYFDWLYRKSESDSNLKVNL